MGFNSVVFICNDAIGQIEKDPVGWWQKTWCELASVPHGKPATYGFGNHCNGFQAVWNQHADNTALIMIGGNMATVVDSTHHRLGHHEEDTQNAFLKEVLEKRGYTVTKNDATRH